jgi:hypothetical protein
LGSSGHLDSLVRRIAQQEGQTCPAAEYQPLYNDISNRTSKIVLTSLRRQLCEVSAIQTIGRGNNSPLVREMQMQNCTSVGYFGTSLAMDANYES